MERYKRGGRMKQSLRKCISVLLLLFCTITLCACGSRNNTSGLTDEESESWKTQTVSFVSQMTTMSDEDLESLLQYGKFYESAVSAWKDNRDVLGAYKDAGQTKCTLDGQIITVTSKMQFEKKDATVTLTINREEKYTDLSVRGGEQDTRGKDEGGRGNTVLGILIVFVVLFFLSFLIYLFKYINLWVAKREQKKGRAAETGCGGRNGSAGGETTGGCDGRYGACRGDYSGDCGTGTDTGRQLCGSFCKKSIETTGREHRRIRYEKPYDHCKRKCI